MIRIVQICQYSGEKMDENRSFLRNILIKFIKI